MMRQLFTFLPSVRQIGDVNVQKTSRVVYGEEAITTFVLLSTLRIQKGIFDRVFSQKNLPNSQRPGNSQSMSQFCKLSVRSLILLLVILTGE